MRTPRLATSGPFAQQVERHGERGEAVDAAPFRVKVHELGRFPAIARDGLQVEEPDGVGDEALFVLDLHRVERAAVRIDADEKVVFFLELVERVG